MLLFTRICLPGKNNRPHARFFHSSLASSLVHELSPIYHLLAGVISPPYCQSVLQPPATQLPSPITTTFSSTTQHYYHQPTLYYLAPLLTPSPPLPSPITTTIHPSTQSHQHHHPPHYLSPLPPPSTQLHSPITITLHPTT